VHPAIVQDKITVMLRHVPAALLLALAACATTPTRWERAGTADPSRDEAECRAAARQQAIDQLPYGDGPPLYGFTSNVSMLQWTMAIDNDRAYLEEDLTKACMRQRGFERVAVPRS
jgi:hypothetical protein